jgi:hypothetical protein
VHIYFRLTVLPGHSIYFKAGTEAMLDAKRPVEVLKKRYLKAAGELEVYDIAEQASGESLDSEAGAFVPTQSKKHARAKVQRYADALAAKGKLTL